MSLLKEIRKQPEHIRETFMWLSVVITISLVGYFSFGSISNDFLAMVNPEKANERALAKAEDKKRRDAASAFSTLGSFGANIGQFLGITDGDGRGSSGDGSAKDEEPVKPRLFPVGAKK